MPMSVVPTRPTMLLAMLHQSARRAVRSTRSTGSTGSTGSTVSTVSTSGGMTQPGAGDVDVLAVPQLEHEQRPDALVVVVDARRVAVEQILDGVAAEVAALQCPRVEQDLARPRAQVAAQPRRQRDREALL